MKNIISKKQLCSFFLSIALVLPLAMPLELFALEEPIIQSEVAVLIDAHSGKILFEKNAYDRHYPASITKIMTALLAIENLSPTDVITFSEEAILGINWNTSRIGIDVGEQLTVDQALHGLMLMSGNEVANGLAEHISGSIEAFATFMTRRARELGATDTNFTNPHGLHNDDHYTTAYDMALITRGVYDNEYFLEIMNNITYVIPATNKTDEVRPLAQQHRLMTNNYGMYRDDVIGGKTGYTDISRHTLVTIAERGETALISVILKGESNTIYSDTNALLDYGFDSYQTLNLHTSNDLIASLPIFSIRSGNLVEVGSANVSLPANQYALVDATVKQRELIVDIDLPDFIEMGMVEGDIIGNISYIHNGEILTSADLIISDIRYNPSPYLVDSPNPNINYSSVRKVSVVVPILLIVLLIAILRIIKVRRYKKQRQLRFSKRLR